MSHIISFFFISIMNWDFDLSKYKSKQLEIQWIYSGSLNGLQIKDMFTIYLFTTGILLLFSTPVFHNFLAISDPWSIFPKVNARDLIWPFTLNWHIPAIFGILYAVFIGRKWKVSIVNHLLKFENSKSWHLKVTDRGTLYVKRRNYVESIINMQISELRVSWT